MGFRRSEVRILSPRLVADAAEAEAGVVPRRRPAAVALITTEASAADAAITTRRPPDPELEGRRGRASSFHPASDNRAAQTDDVLHNALPLA